MTIVGLAAAAEETETERNNKGAPQTKEAETALSAPSIPSPSRSVVHCQMKYEARGEIKLGSEGSATDREREREREREVCKVSV